MACIGIPAVALAQNIPTGGGYAQLAAAWDPSEGPWAYTARRGHFDYRAIEEPDDLSAASEVGPPALYPLALADAGCSGFTSHSEQDPERVLEQLIVDWTAHHLPYLWHLVGRATSPIVSRVAAGDLDPKRLSFKPFGISEFSIRKRRVAIEREFGDALTVTLSLREEHHRFEYDRSDRGERFRLVSLVLAHRFR